MVIVITGGSSGIGRQVAIDLLKEDHSVVILSHDDLRLAAAEEFLRGISPKITAYRCDVRKADDVASTFDQILRQHGQIDVLINNAGYAVYRSFEESSLAELLDLVDVNLLGVIRCMKAVLPSMKARHSGQIVNISSLAGEMIITPNGTYGASKHGVNALSEATRYELEYFGITVSVVCPGRVETPFFDHETFKQRTERPENRMTVPIEKVSRAIIRAIHRKTVVSFVPRRLAVLSWVYEAFPWFVRPLYGRLLRSRVRSLYSHMESKGKENQTRWGKGAVDIEKQNLPALKARRVLDTLEGLPAQASLLDYGCGEGKMLNTIRRYRPTMDLHGVDVQAPLGAPDFQFKLIDNGSSGLRPASFDVILALDVLEHVPDPDRVLREIQQLLRPGGKFLAFVPLEGETLAPYWIYRGLFGKDLYVQTKKHIQAFTRHEFLKTVEKYFDIEDVSYSYHLMGTLFDSTFFALCGIPSIGNWWWNSNPIYNQEESHRKSSAGWLMDLANRVCFIESSWLKSTSAFATGLHIVAKPRK